MKSQQPGYESISSDSSFHSHDSYDAEDEDATQGFTDSGEEDQRTHGSTGCMNTNLPSKLSPSFKSKIPPPNPLIPKSIAA